MKLWNSKGDIDALIEAFTIGDDPEYDMRLAAYDVIGSIAHASMLRTIDYLTEAEHEELNIGLQEILAEIKIGKFEILPGVEDVHSQVEFLLTQRFGEVGKKLHVGRSRNDQIAVDLKLYYRDVIKDISADTMKLVETLLAKARETKEILMPGYTHSQAGMVSSFGLWYSSFAESLVDDLTILKTVAKVVDQNPLGSAAGYGSSLPNDRDFTSKQLGFQGVIANSIYAQAARGKAEMQLGMALASIAMTINRLASDICIYSNENYKFLSLPDALTTGSSIMPHKKNPDVLELTRAKCNQIVALPGRLQLLLVNMQTGYHRDYQLLKEMFFPELDRMKQILEIVNYCIPNISEKKDIMEDEKYKLCFTVENINDLVHKGIPFRDAYHQVKREVQEGSFVPLKKLNHTHLGSIGNLGLEVMEAKLKQLSNF